MPNISSELSTPGADLRLGDVEFLASIIKQFDKFGPMLASEGSDQVVITQCRLVAKLRNLHKRLVSPDKKIRVLIALHDVTDWTEPTFVVKAATENLQVFEVDRRSGSEEKVKIFGVKKVASAQDFREVVFDTAAENIQRCPSDAERISQSLSE